MFHNSSGNLTAARQAAQDNANYFQRPYVVYTDTSGNMRVCRQGQEPKNPALIVEVVSPQETTKDAVRDQNNRTEER